MSESQPATTYVPRNQYNRWEERAEELDMSMSNFISSMTEAGMKKFEIDSQRDETAQNLRRQRNEMQQQLEQKRQRISQLERERHRGAKQAIEDCIEESDGPVSYSEIVQSVADSLPSRIADLLEIMDGEEIETTVQNQNKAYRLNNA